MVRFTVSAGLLGSAFSPVAVLLALVVAPFECWWLNIALAAILALPLAALPLVFRAVRRLAAERVQTRKVRRRDVDILSMLSSFVLPIAVAFFAPDDARTPASAVVLVFLVLVYVRGGLQYLNPMFVLLGFHLYALELENGAEVFMLSRKRHIQQVGAIDIARFSETVFFERDAQ